MYEDESDCAELANIPSRGLRRIKVVRIPQTALLETLKTGILPAKQRIPADARIASVFHSIMAGEVVLMVQSESFPEVELSEFAPLCSPELKINWMR